MGSLQQWIGRRLNFGASQTGKGPVAAPGRADVPTGVAHAAEGEIRPTADPDREFELGKAAEARGDADTAFHHYAVACRIVNRHGPTAARLAARAQQLFADAVRARDSDKRDEAIRLIVRAIEFNPESGEMRSLLKQLLTARNGSIDLTTRCFTYRDPQRGESIHREAIGRCMEYVANSGIVGDILEFGVLGGWSARMFAEAMRDEMYLGDLCLFDSFEGLPRQKSAVDAASYEVGGRNLWKDEMAFPESFLAPLGAPLEEHIHGALNTIISAERIHVFKGYYAETLRAPLNRRAALVHVDCDLYQSTVEVLEGLDRHGALQDGCVLMFDDWNCNKASPHFGERRAFAEFLQARHGRWTASSFFTYGFNGAAFFLHEEVGPPETAGSAGPAGAPA